MKGVDLSTHNKKVDYKKLKQQGIDFAIIRCGYGKDDGQKDAMFETHYKGLKEAGIKVGVYHYSYCTSIENAKLEAKNCLKFIEGKTFELPVFYDLEETRISNLGKEAVTKIAKLFCEEITNAGYQAGVYANLYWYRTFIDVNQLINYRIWLAQWNSNNEIKHSANFRVDYLQYAVSYIDGVEGRCDLDYCYIPNHTKSNEEIAEEVIKGLWGNSPERQKLLEANGYNYYDIQNIINQKMKNKKKSNEEIANEVIKGFWDVQPKRQKLLEDAGYNYNEIQKIVNQKMKK